MGCEMSKGEKQVTKPRKPGYEVPELFDLDREWVSRSRYSSSSEMLVEWSTVQDTETDNQVSIKDYQ